MTFDLDVIVYLGEGINDPVENLFSSYLYVGFTGYEKDLVCDDRDD